MASTSSKALPFISIATAFGLAVLSILGFGAQVDKVIAVLGIVLPITASGGLINKAIEAIVAKRNDILSDPNFEATVKKIVQDVKDAGNATVTTTNAASEGTTTTTASNS